MSNNTGVINIQENNFIVVEPSNTCENLTDVFCKWMADNCEKTDFVVMFESQLDERYRMSLFNFINRNFNNEELVDNTTLFYWKILVCAFMKLNKKYAEYVQLVDINNDNKTCNLTLVKFKHIFKCFIEREHVCWFKENDTLYYVS